MLKELFYPTDGSLLFISSFFFYLTNHLLLSVKKHQITFLYNRPIHSLTRNNMKEVRSLTLSTEVILYPYFHNV